MSRTVVKTLEATLAPPTAHKERKLIELLTTYREALAAAFDAGADTMSKVNDIVTEYDLPYQAKDALKSYVPELLRNRDARELRAEHPLRFVNRAATFDRDPTREHEICWRIPRSGRGTNVWVPLRINPDQKSLWTDLLDGDAEPGELRLQRHRTKWALHVTVTYPVETIEMKGEPTYVGLDIGETALVTGCALKCGAPTQPFIYSGSEAKRLRKELHTTLQRLQERDASEWRIDERTTHYQNALTDIIEKASRRAVAYAQEFTNPVLVLEDLTFIREQMDYGAIMNRRLHSWAFARVQRRIADKAREAGIPVHRVSPAYTSQTCHACGKKGKRPTQAEFECTHAACHVSTFQADINAAANIANRADPWGESCPWKLDNDDSPRDGSPRDRTNTGPTSSRLHPTDGTG